MLVKISKSIRKYCEEIILMFAVKVSYTGRTVNVTLFNENNNITERRENLMSAFW